MDTEGSSKDSSAREVRRYELRQLNLAATARGGAPNGLGKLDTSLKRHTTLLTRLKSSMNPLNLTAILKDIQTLSLDKYVEEAVGATFEGLIKCKKGPEVDAAVEIVSALHQRFPESFTKAFTALILQSLKPSQSAATDRDAREKEDSARIVKQRTLLRILGELESVAVISKDNGKTGDVTWSVLKELLTADKESLGLVAPLAIGFAKHLGAIYLPAVNPNDDVNSLSAQDFPELVHSDSVSVSSETKEKFRKLFLAYFDALGRREVKNYSELQKQDKRNHEAYIRSGEVFEDREKLYERSLKSWERGWSAVTQLSELLDVPVPSLPSLSTSTVGTSIVTNGTSTFAGTSEEVGGPASCWNDEEEKKFYTDLKDLAIEVPPNILGTPATTKVTEKEKEEIELAELTEAVSLREIENTLEVESMEIDPAENSAIVAPSADLPAGPAAQLTALLSKLDEASSRTAIDQIALEFAFLNSKAARKRLAKFLGGVNRNRQEILPYYARLAATLNPFMPEITKELIAMLEEEFRFLQRKKNSDLAETRSKNLRFFAELTKFGIMPAHSIFHVFKVLLDDLIGPNVDNLCTLLEHCGRYLLRSESTRERMQVVLETLKRKRSSMRFDERQILMLDNAFYQANPPERSQIIRKEYTPIELWIKHLFYTNLTRSSSDRVLKLVRKLDWSDKFIQRKLHNAFTKVWKIKFSNVHLFAILLYDLGRYHPQFLVSVVDQVCENVRIGLEANNFKFNQQRIATIKYLGELYNYRCVESKLIFDTLWSLVTFGHPQSRPSPDVISTLDSDSDYFRIRLVCTLLDCCGTCFDRGQLKSKLDSFLVFFQMYCFSKSNLPIEVQFMISDLFETLRPKMKLFTNYDEAASAVDEMLAASEVQAQDEEEGEDHVTDSGVARGAVSASSSSEAEEIGSESDSETDSDEGENSDSAEIEDELEPGVTRGVDPNAMTSQDELEFERELAKLSSGTAEIRKPSERKQNFLAEVSLPFIKKQTGAAAGSATTGKAFWKGGDFIQPGTADDITAAATATSVTSPAGMSFSLLTKKGAKQQIHAMQVPLESNLVKHSLQQQKLAEQEQREMKKLVLEYEQREHDSEKQNLVHEMAKRGISLQYAGEKKQKPQVMKVVP